MANVLILGCGTQGLAIVKNIKKAGHTTVIMGERHNYADTSRYADHFIHSIDSPSNDSFLKSVIGVIRQFHIETVVPMGDIYSEFLSRNRTELQQMVRYQMPDYDVWMLGVDKSCLMRACKDRGYPVPFTLTNEKELQETEKKQMPFPMLIKPNITCGGRGMTLVYSYEELMEKYPVIKAEFGDCHFQQYVNPGGSQVEVQLYVDENKQLLYSSVIYKYRWYPENGGSSCCAVSVRNDKIVTILHNLLVDLNWVGFADFDTIENPETGELLIMELNPRVPACVKCALEAGIPWGQILVDEYMGKPRKSYDYKEGEYLRHLGFEVLWFLKSPHRFKTHPNWFKFVGRHIHYQDMSDWSDLKPFFSGTFRNIKKVLTHKEKEKIIR